MVDRREFVKAALGGMAFSGYGFSQTPTAKLTDAISPINAGTNVVALSTSDGLILVDSGSPQSTDALMKEIGSGRVHTVFNTHYHLENTGGNEAAGKSGTRILAHQSTKEWM